MTSLLAVLIFFKMDKNPKVDNINYTMEVGRFFTWNLHVKGQWRK